MCDDSIYWKFTYSNRIISIKIIIINPSIEIRFQRVWYCAQSRIQQTSPGRSCARINYSKQDFLKPFHLKCIAVFKFPILPIRSESSSCFWSLEILSGIHGCLQTTFSIINISIFVNRTHSTQSYAVEASLFDISVELSPFAVKSIFWLSSEPIRLQEITYPDLVVARTGKRKLLGVQRSDNLDVPLSRPLSCVTLLENGVTKNVKHTFPARTFFTQLLFKICGRSDLNHFRRRVYLY